MDFDGASVEIFDMEARRVYRKEFPPTMPNDLAFWDGIKNDGSKAIPGTYIYIIKRNNDIVCKGSFVLVR